MKFKEKKITLIMTGIFSVIYIIAFWLAYIGLYTSAPVFMLTVSSYFTEIFSLTIPPVAAMLMLITYSEKKMSAVATRALIYSSLSLLYTFPESAFGFAYEGYEITDVLLLTLLKCLVTLVSLSALYFLLFFLMLFVTKYTAKKNTSRDFSLKEMLKKEYAFNFSSPVTLGILTATGGIFIYAFVLEIISTVTFLINYSENYMLREVFSMIFRYIFILGIFIISQILTVFLKNTFIGDGDN